MSESLIKPPALQTTRVFSFVTHVQLIGAYDAYVREIGKAPRIEIRGLVSVVEPGRRPNTWRKKREVDLSDWSEVRDWKRNEPLLLIWYWRTSGLSRNAVQSTDQWVSPTALFDHKWFDVRLCPSLAYKNKAESLSKGADGCDVCR